MAMAFQSQAKKIDWRIFRTINGLAGRWRALDVPMVALAKFGPAAMAVALGLLWFTGKGPERSRRRRMVVRASLGYAGSRGLKVAINRLAPRPRPYEEHDVRLLVKPTSKPSFPSNHAAESWAMAWAVRDGPPLLAGAMLALALLIGLSRVYVGRHYPSDVAGGVLLAAAAGALSTRIPQLQPRPKK